MQFGQGLRTDRAAAFDRNIASWSLAMQVCSSASSLPKLEPYSQIGVARVGSG